MTVPMPIGAPMLFSTVKRISPWMSGTENEPSQSAAARDG